MDIEGKTFEFLLKTFWRIWVKNGFCVSIGNFWAKKHLMKLLFFNIFELWTKKASLLSKLFDAVVKTAVYVSVGPFWGKKFIEKLWFLVKFGHWATIFGLLSKFWLRLSKMPTMSVHLWEKLNFQKTFFFFITFQTLR